MSYLISLRVSDFRVEDGYVFHDECCLDELTDIFQLNFGGVCGDNISINLRQPSEGEFHYDCLSEIHGLVDIIKLHISEGEVCTVSATFGSGSYFSYKNFTITKRGIEYSFDKPTPADDFIEKFMAQLESLSLKAVNDCMGKWTKSP